MPVDTFTLLVLMGAVLEAQDMQEGIYWQSN